MTGRARLIVALAGLSGLWPAAAAAQGVAGPGRFEAAGGLLWTGSASFGGRDATLTTSSGAPYRLFSTSTDLAAAVGVELSVGARVAGRVLAEAVVSYSFPELHTTVASDVEGVNPVTAIESVRQFTVGGAALVNLKRRDSGLMPFLRAGVGYLRQLHETRTLVETGQIYDVGGGVKWPLRSTCGTSGWVLGIRVEGRASIRAGGVAVDGKAHASPAAAASFFVRF